MRNRNYQLHGRARTPIYEVWMGMHRRCDNPRHASYKRYGGRGIKVCERWAMFENFLADMGEQPSGMWIERIDNDGDYRPDNCRWATPVEQARNTSRTKFLEFNGRRLAQCEWEERIGLKPGTLRGRLAKGWSLERALTTPPLKRSLPPLVSERNGRYYFGRNQIALGPDLDKALQQAEFLRRKLDSAGAATTLRPEKT